MATDVKGMFEGMKPFFDRLKKNRYFLAVLLFGAVLLMLPLGSDGEDAAASVYTGVAEPGFSLREEEERIASALSEISGAGKVEVVLTLESGIEMQAAQDSETELYDADAESDCQSSVETVVVSTDGADCVVAVKYFYPEYKGALVVCEGAGSAGVKLAVTKAVSALTGLGSDRITVTKMEEKR